MLKQRVITALLLARLFSPACTGCRCRCWPRFRGGRRPGRLGVGAAGRGLAAQSSRTLYALLVWPVGGGAVSLRRLWRPVGDEIQPVLGLACLWWCFALLWVKSFPASKAVLWASPVMRLLMGMLILLPAWFAAVYLLHIEQHGAVMVVLVLMVAAADIGAYFTGRAFGRHALSPERQPG
jgi:phosphatidate cytidylyltransferase